MQDSLGPMVVSKVLINSFYVWLKDRVEPLCDNFETLFSEQTANVGLEDVHLNALRSPETFGLTFREIDHFV